MRLREGARTGSAVHDPAQTGKRLPRRIEGGVVGPIDHIRQHGKRLRFYTERKIIRRPIADEGDRGVLLQGGINERQEPAGATINRDQGNASRLRREGKATAQRSSQIQPNARPPFGGHGRSGEKTIRGE